MSSRLPLRPGARGVFEDRGYTLTGRIRLGQAGKAGARWDEWHLRFDDGATAWLARAQGRLYLTQEGDPFRPGFDDLRVYLTYTPIFMLAEKGEAEVLGVEGDLPATPVRGERYRYADLSGPAGAFATVDYRTVPPTIYTGREVGADELGLAPDAVTVADPPRPCPACGVPVSLYAPDETVRCTCPRCRVPLDVSDDGLRVAGAAAEGGPVPVIPLGTTTTDAVEGRGLTVVAFLRRGYVSDGVRGHWDEYLLYHPYVGFRWLICAEGHWTYAWSIGIGETPQVGMELWFERIRSRREPAPLHLLGRTTPRGLHMEGEFPWAVVAGDVTKMVDYARPPLALSLEHTRDEMAPTLGVYLLPADVRALVGVKRLPRRAGTAAHQPRSKTYAGLAAARWWMRMLHAMRQKTDIGYESPDAGPQGGEG